MKKILFFSHAMEIGGAERALLGLLEIINTTNYQVDLFLMRHEGELMKFIPPKINLLPEILQYTCLAVPFGNVIRKKQIGMVVGRLYGKRKAKKRVRILNLPEDNDVSLQYSHKYTLPFVPKINNTYYDLAISFLTPHYFVAEKVSAKKKIAWIHTDYAAVAVDKTEQLAMWRKYDYIASISDNVTKTFVRIFPDLKAKVELLPNIMPMRYMYQLTNEYSVENEMLNDGSIKLLSIGRFCKAKNFDNVPMICKRVLSLGLNVKWYLIGYGGDEMLIKQKIIEAGMQKHVIILGKKVNPYPYIKNCDIYVQPSRYEGKCVSVIEAQMLNRPVIITDFPTSDSQLDNGVDGIIVPMDIENCASGIVNVIKNGELRQKLIYNTKKRDYTNAYCINRLYQLMENI